MQSKLSVFLDTLFLSVISFFISYATFKTFLSNPIVCLVLAIAIFILCWKIIFPQGIKSWRKKYTSFHEHKHMEKCNFTLQTSENDAILTFFEQLFAKTFIVEKKDNYLIIDKKLLVCFDYLSDVNQKRFVLNAYIEANKLGIYEIAIFTESASIDTTSYAKNLKNISIYFFDKVDTYKLMQKYDTYIVDKNSKVEYKPFSNLKNMSLNKKKARSFLFTSFLLYFSSLFIPFSGYYLIFASLSLILSIICFAMSEPKAEIKQSYLLQSKNN